MKKSVLIALITLMMISCKDKNEVKNTLNPYDDAAYTASKLSQPSAACDCITPVQANNCNNNAPNPAIQAYLGTAPSKTIIITWTGCNASNNASGNGCGVPLSGVTSTLIMCYSANASNPCNVVNAHFIGKPQCLPCMPYEFCIDLTPSKSGNNYVLYGNYNNEPFNNITISVAISADPDIVINCTSNIGGGSNQVSYNCTGYW